MGHWSVALHSDSLGTEQVIRPGQLNLMTAGHGIAHAELAAKPPFRGVQMWIAQPETTRHGAPAFEHHAELARFEVSGLRGLVLVGALQGIGVDTVPAAGRGAAGREAGHVVELRGQESDRA